MLYLLPGVSNGQVTANFTVDHTSGCVPLIVHFTNTSTGATSYSWDFGNTTGSFLPNPSGTSYLSAGTYTVTLTAYNGPSSSTHTAVITVYPLPAAAFSTTDTAVCPNVPVNFTNTSTAGMPGAMTYSWNFGDGATSTLASPSHPYTAAGFYTITLYATNSGGCTTPYTRSGYVHIFPAPIVGFSSPTPNVCAALTSISFSNSTVGTAPLSYMWAFGDGGTNTTAAPSHAYTSSGSYNVKLKVTNGNGCKDSLTRSGYVNVGNLTASYSSASSVCVQTALGFTNTSGPHLSSYWTFGNGDNSTDENPSYTYTTSGTYSVKLKVYNGTCYDSTTHTVTVYPKPTFNFSANPVIPCPSALTQTFTATMPAGSTATWSFGDGTAIVSGNPVIHNFTAYQITPLTLTVTDTHGCVDSLHRPDTLNSLILAISATSNQGCIPLSSNFGTTIYSTVTDRITPPGTDPAVFPYPASVVSYTWNFGDGSPTSASPTPTHTFTALGTFVVNLSILTANGCTRTASYVVKTGTPPSATFTATPTHICTRRLVSFIATPTAGTPTNYEWQFGDGNYGGGTLTTTSHTYNIPGTYTVELTPSNNGCPSATPYKVPIIVDSPGSAVAYSYLCTPANGVQFYDYSLGDNSRTWLFGDGDTSIFPNPVHYYPSLTTFPARLATYNATTGCRDTSLPITIDLGPISFDFYAFDTTLCPLQVDTFYAGSLLPGQITAYRWSVDDTDHGMNADTLIYATSYPGFHTVRLIITDLRGCFDTLIKPHYIHVANPRSVFSASVSAGCLALPVTLTDHSTDDPGVAVTSYKWVYGDGDSLVTGPVIVAHTYTAPGAYNVVETVTDAFGCIDTGSIGAINVYKPTAAFYALPTAVCAGSAIHFVNTSSDSGALWQFGDGGSSTLTSPYHVYTTAGTYPVQLITVDSHGCRDTLTYTSYITVHGIPTAAFTMSDTFAVCPPLNVAFTNMSTGASNYYWIFGNGSFSSLPAPSNPYTASGLYIIKLAAINSFGCSDTATHSATVFGYTGAFAYTPVTGCTPLPIHFNVVLGSVSSVVWDFGDGFISSASLSDTISHTYANHGSYIPKLILTDTTGCVNFSLGTDTIKADAVTADFYISPNPSCANGTILLTDVSLSDYSTISSYMWAISGGAASASPSVTHTYTAAGVYTVSLTTTDAIGCSGTVIKNVTVNPLPAAITGNHSVCVGFTSSLFSSPGSGTWSSGATAIATISSSGVVTGVAPGTAGITYTLPTGCVTTTVVTVFVLPATISGPTDLCQGTTATLSTGTTGGTWSSSAPSVVSVTTSGVITGGATGPAVITYTGASGCYVTQGVTVESVPAPVTGASAVCEGSTITLSTTTTGATWSSSNPGIATIDPGGVVYGITAGSVTITCFLYTCYRTFDLVVNPLPPAITGALQVCYASTTTLANTVPGGSWNSSSPGVASIDADGIVTGLFPSVSTITYTLTTGCKTWAEVTVNPLPEPIEGNLDICIGAVVSMSDPTPFGAWSISDPAIATINPATGAVTGISGGTVVITYTLPTGCITTAISTVNIAPPPITGSLTVCAGFMSNLSNAMPGGMWSCSPPPTIATIHPLTGVVSGVTPGNVTVSYTVLSGCISTAVVTVNPLPPPITGVPRVCLGSVTTLGDTSPGGTWESSNIGVATTAPGGLISGLAPGTTVITYTIPTGCINIIVVTVNPLPLPINGPDTVCEGSTVTFTDATTAGAWTTANTAIAYIGLTSGVLMGVMSGITLVSYTVPATGCYTTRPILVHATPASIMGAANVCIGSPVTLLCALSGGVWTSSNPAVATVGATSGIVTGILTGGTFTITYTLPTGGCQATKNMTVNTLPATYNVTGGGSYCAGGSGVHVGLNNSDIGVSYALYYGTAATGYLAGTGTALDFGVLTVAGSYTVLATNATTGCKKAMSGSATVTITPNVAPSVTIAGPARDTVCPGIVTTFLPHPVNGGSAPTYEWKVNGIPVWTGSSYSFLPAAGDVITVKMNSTGTCVLPATALNTLTVLSFPAGIPSVSVSVDPNDTVCEFTTATFTTSTAFAGPGGSYMWFINGAVAGTAPTLSYMPDNGDIIRCRLTSDYVCRLADTASSSAITITVEPVLVPHVTVSASPGLLVAQGSMVTLHATVADAGLNPAYQWYVNGMPVPAATTNSYVSQFNDYDSVTCRVTSSGVCPDITGFDWVFVSVKPAGVSAVSATNNIGIIPNPSNGTFTIKGNLSTTMDQSVAIEMVDMLGQNLFSRQVQARKGRINELVELPGTTANGMYLLKVISANESEAFHVIISR